MTHIGDKCVHILVRCKLDYVPLIETVLSVNYFLQHEKQVYSVHIKYW